jgi:hypothetical protein
MPTGQHMAWHTLEVLPNRYTDVAGPADMPAVYAANRSLVLTL